MKTRKLTLWCPDYRGIDGGIQQFSRLLAEALPQCPSVGSFRTVPYRPGLGPPRHIRFAASILADLATRRPDLVICSHLHLARLCPLLRAARIPYWICLHGIECWDTGDPRDHRAIHGAERLLCVSRFTRQQISARFPEASSRIVILPDHAEDPPARRPSRIEARAALGLPADGTLLLIVSRLAATESYKGHRLLFHALKRLGPSGPGLIVAGDGDARPALAAEAGALGLDARVFFTGRLNDQQLECAYAAADAFAMPSTGEGFGIVFLEALLRGVPVLGGNRDATPDPLQDGRAGILVDPSDPVSLDGGLRELLARQWDRAELARMTREHFGRHLLPGRLEALLRPTDQAPAP